ncbi:MAG: ABC transporter ATP-binding protein [Planctomycetes bacterium]|nr:ABC transporter ATP-binding protein [Planctomycetota bacterium]
MEAEAPILIRLRGAERVFGSGGARTVALAGLDLDIPAGQVLAVVGPSGSGKSTLLHLVGAMDTPTAGRVEVAGRNLAELDDAAAARYRRETLGFVFQFFNLIPTLPVLENVALPARLAGLAASDAQARAAELLARVGLASKLAAYPDALSGGQQQRVAIARALVNRPRIVLADEPTGALDQATGEEVLRLLREVVREAGVTLLMATHGENVVAVCDRMIRIVDGKLAADELVPAAPPGDA